MNFDQLITNPEEHPENLYSVSISGTDISNQRTYEDADFNFTGLHYNETPITTETSDTSIDLSKLVHTQAPNTSTNERLTLQALPIEEDPMMFPQYGQCQNQIYRKEIPGRKNYSWLGRLVDQRGEQYIYNKLTIDEISKNIDRIIDDIINEKIDYNKYGKYMLEIPIVETLINYCANKLAINKAIQYAATYLYNDYANRGNGNYEMERMQALSQINDSFGQNLMQAIVIIDQDIRFYELLHSKLKMVESSKNILILASISSELAEYKKILKRRY